MRIATWNVNSVKQRVPRLLPWLERRRPDVVCLQETKLSDAAFADLLAEPLAERGYTFAHHGQGQWNGVALLSRVGLDDVEHGFAGQPDYAERAEARAISATASSGAARRATFTGPLGETAPAKSRTAALPAIDSEG